MVCGILFFWAWTIKVPWPSTNGRRANCLPIINSWILGMGRHWDGSEHLSRICLGFWQNESVVINCNFFPCCLDELWPMNMLSYTFVFEQITTTLHMQTLAIPVMLLTLLASATFWWDIWCGKNNLGYRIAESLAVTTAVECFAEDVLPTCPEWLWMKAFKMECFPRPWLILDEAQTMQLPCKNPQQFLNFGE